MPLLFLGRKESWGYIFRHIEQSYIHKRRLTICPRWLSFGECRPNLLVGCGTMMSSARVKRRGKGVLRGEVGFLRTKSTPILNADLTPTKILYCCLLSRPLDIHLNSAYFWLPILNLHLESLLSGGNLHLSDHKRGNDDEYMSDDNTSRNTDRLVPGFRVDASPISNQFEVWLRTQHLFYHEN